MRNGETVEIEIDTGKRLLLNLKQLVSRMKMVIEQFIML